MTIIIITVLIILLIIALYVIRNLLLKNEKQEDILMGYMAYLNKISKIIDFSDAKLKEIDARGTFKSDDEVGFFFQQLQAIQEVLNTFNIKNL
jgi:hypothetical protein